jgi:hypothetical protein
MAGEMLAETFTFPECAPTRGSRCASNSVRSNESDSRKTFEISRGFARERAEVVQGALPPISPDVARV